MGELEKRIVDTLERGIAELAARADHITRLESDVEVLRKALADLLIAVAEDFPDDPAEHNETAVQCYGMEATPSALKFGHMRKAREALSRISSGGRPNG